MSSGRTDLLDIWVIRENGLLGTKERCIHLTHGQLSSDQRSKSGLLINFFRTVCGGGGGGGVCGG